ncbi:MAG: AbrB/MazE/SpoVT family DNA-binding domain-containing protein [Microbacterium sp.]
MSLTIDRAGRLVVPKRLRDAMGLQPGSPLRADLIDGRLVIEFEPQQAKVEVEDGLPVIRMAHEEQALTDAEVRDTLERVRNESAAHV